MKYNGFCRTRARTRTRTYILAVMSSEHFFCSTNKFSAYYSSSNLFSIVVVGVIVAVCLAPHSDPVQRGYPSGGYAHTDMNNAVCISECMWMFMCDLCIEKWPERGRGGRKEGKKEGHKRESERKVFPWLCMCVGTTERKTTNKKNKLGRRTAVYVSVGRGAGGMRAYEWRGKNGMEENIAESHEIDNSIYLIPFLSLTLSIYR